MRSAGFVRAASWATSRRPCCPSSDWRSPARCPVTTSGRRRRPILIHPAEEGAGQLRLAHQEVELVVAREPGARPVAATEEGDPGIEDPELRVEQLVRDLPVEADGSPLRSQEPPGRRRLRVGRVPPRTKGDNTTTR